MAFNCQRVQEYQLSLDYLQFKFMPNQNYIMNHYLISLNVALSASRSYFELCLVILLFFLSHYLQCCFVAPTPPLCQNKALFHQLSLKDTWQPTRMAQRQNKEGRLIKYSLLFLSSGSLCPSTVQQLHLIWSFIYRLCRFKMGQGSTPKLSSIMDFSSLFYN